MSHVTCQRSWFIVNDRNGRLGQSGGFVTPTDWIVSGRRDRSGQSEKVNEHNLISSFFWLVGSHQRGRVIDRRPGYEGPLGDR